MKINKTISPIGFTIKEFKELIKNWPEEGDENGEPNHVWLGDGSSHSNICTEIWPLNYRTHADDTYSADILLKIG